MPEEKIYDSPESEPGDDFRLDLGRKMIEGSSENVQKAAQSLMTGLGLLKAIYLGICGFADFIPKTHPLAVKGLFMLPLVIWLIALYSCLQVMMTKLYDININSPDEIRTNYRKVIIEKQRDLKIGFWLLTAGLFTALVLLLYRIGM